MKKISFYLRIAAFIAFLFFMVSNFGERSFETDFTNWHYKGLLFFSMTVFFILAIIGIVNFLYNGIVVTTIVEEEDND